MDKRLRLIYLHLLIVASVGLAKCADGDNNVPEPPFPSLMDATNPRFQIHITSESFDANHGYETIEEYVDLEIGKAAYTGSNKQGHRTTFIDSTTQTIYRYKPYSCLMLKQSELISSSETGVWSKMVKVHRANKLEPSFSSQDRDLHLFVVAAVWMNAAEMRKTYSKTSVVYSSGKDIFRPAHRWTIKDGPNVLVHLYFIDETVNSDTEPSSNRMSLEMIQQEVDGKIERTINVLSIDYYIPSDIYETLLQVPLGYGCKPDNKPADFEDKQQLINAPGRERPNRLRMEVTATKFEADKRSTDTISVDLLAKAFDRSESYVQMVRQRNSHSDFKVVSDYLLRVQYNIDLRRGSCSLSHATSGEADSDKFSVEFNNGLKLGFEWPIIRELFDSNPNCDLIKITGRDKPTEFLYEECSGERIFTQRPARIMRKYSLKQNDPMSLSLESVTIWALDDGMDATSILESYHFYIVEDDSIRDRLELARLFDISEECYLNNDRMRYGRDYAWIELTYPMSSRELDILASHSHEFKRRILEQFRLLFDSLMRMPRVELMFTDSGVLVKLLMLDEPSLIYMWDSYPQRLLVSSGDTLTETAVDVEHCADLCRLHRCQVMSYCAGNYACLIRSTELNQTELNKELQRDNNCETFAPSPKNNDFLVGPTRQESLHFVISRLQHEDLASIELPKLPDELAYPQSMTGLTDDELSKKQTEYLIELFKKLDEQDRLLPTLAMMFRLDGGVLFLVPSKFELERDPLAEFSLQSEESLDDGPDQVAAFHEGLPLYRYKLSAFRNTESPLDARQYIGLNYDQCSLACIDGRCSSFSYCKHRQDCIITNIYNIAQAKSDERLVQDSDCFIAQRDFLSKFNQFQNVLRPAVYKKSSPAHNEAECAHSCVVESDFNCLAFDYCEGDPQTGSQCYYMDTRLIYTGSGDKNQSRLAPVTNEKKRPDQVTGCSHFSRSYLAEFTRIAYREINESELAKLKSTIFIGQSVDRCADICLNELDDCSAFQFCFNPESKDRKQRCIMIESKPEDQDERGFRIVQDSSGNVLEQGKFFATSMDCHVFALRRDTSEAQMRDVALEPLSPAEAKARESQIGNAGGMTIGAAFVLYLTTTALFAVVGCALVLLKHHNSYVSERYDRFKAIFGYY